MRKLLIATNNPGKIREAKKLLRDLPLEMVGLEDIAPGFDIKETGSSFRENAVLKAKASFSKTGLLTIADDSGLEVDALDGKPGVYSARFFGDVTQEEKNKGILRLMKNVPKHKRQARFIIAMAIAIAGRDIRIVEGVMEGEIALKAKGKNGFGYDPIFIPQGFTKTNAQLTIEEKNKISHRGKALKKTRKILKEILDAGY